MACRRERLAGCVQGKSHRRDRDFKYSNRNKSPAPGPGARQTTANYCRQSVCRRQPPGSQPGVSLPFTRSMVHDCDPPDPRDGAHTTNAANDEFLINRRQTLKRGRAGERGRGKHEPWERPIKMDFHVTFFSNRFMTPAVRIDRFGSACSRNTELVHKRTAFGLSIDPATPAFILRSDILRIPARYRFASQL
ncbi:tRNA-splicing endonuclease subunit Sen2 isoform 3 [Anopheles sinensis]|uniref:tRNA-splicing endonuclease subunit Sen2 isoform 3 n=1 Tax=Anopheles sinensis TaxID=74873 RepID=A0A084WD73_ANOSI|nr:tRNA-splicing endonuclease subunit Sen2 isoform 3 [Anopheles sinensis]